MPTYEFSMPDGQSFEIDSPSELNQEQLSYVASNHKQFLAAKQSVKSTSLLQDVALGGAGVLNTLDTIGNLAIRAPVQAAIQGDQVLPGIQDSLNARIKARIEGINPENLEQGIGGKVVSALPQFFTAPLSPAETAKQFKEAGESNTRARLAGGVDAVGNAIGLILPGVGKTIGTKVIGGVVTNTAQEYAVKKIQQQIATNSDLQKSLEPTMDTLIPAAIIGGGFGILHKQPSTRETYNTDKLTALDQIAPKTEDQVIPGKAAGEVAAPIDTQYLAERRAQDRQQQILDQQRHQAEAEARGINSDSFESTRKTREEQSKALQEEVASKQVEETRTQALIKSAEQEAHQRALKEQADREALSTGENTPGSGPTVNRKPVPNPEGPFGSLGSTAGIEGEPQGIPRSLSTGENAVGKGSTVESKSPAPGNSSFESNSNKFDEVIQRQKDLESLVSNLDQAQRKSTQQQSALMRGSSPTIRVPRNQRGAINIDEIAKAFGASFKRVQEAFNGIPGHETTGKDMLVTYPDAVEYLAKVKAGLSSIGDRWAKWESFRSGSSMKYIETQHPVIKAAADYMQAASQRADHAITHIVKPIEHQLQKLGWNNKKEFVELAQLMKKEMFERRTFTEDQLRQAGFSDKQISTYTALRDAYDKAWRAQEEALKSNGFKPGKDGNVLSKAEYYLSSRWTGDWRSDVYDKDGRLMWVVKDHTQKGVEQALDHLASQGIEFDRAKSKAEFSRGNSRTPQDIPAAFASMIQHLGETHPLSDKIREVMNAKMMGEAQNTLAQSKHFKNKANIRGFVGDRPWMDPYHDARDMFHEQLNYLKNSFQWSEYNKAADQVKQIINDPEVVAQAHKASQQATHIIDHYLGSHQRMFQNLENNLALWTGHSVQDVRNGMGLARTAWILQKMGTNLGAVAQNVVQMVNTLPWHRDMTLNGLEHNATKTLIKSINDTIGGMAAHYGNAIGARSPAHALMTNLGRDALKYAESNGILNLSSFDEHTNVNSGRAQVALQRTLGAPIQIADKFSKFAAFMSFAHHIEQAHPGMPRMEVLREAQHYMNASMVDPRMQERPFIVQDTGLIGTAGSTLQGYTMNYLNQAHYFANKALKEGKFTPLILFLGISGGMAGLAGMTGLNYAISGYDALRNAVAKHNPEWYDNWPDIERKLLVDVGEGIGKNVDNPMLKSFLDKTGEAIKYGITSVITGADLSKKFETSVSAPIWGPLKDVYDQGSAILGGLSQGDSKGLAQAAYAVAPSGVAQGLIDVDSGAFQDKRSGKYAPPTSGDFSKGYFRSDTDKLMRRLGITSIPESRQKEIIYQQAKAQANDKLVNNGLAEKYVRSLMEGDGEKGKNAYVANLAKRAPDQTQQLIQASMQKYIIDHNLDASAINVMKAKHLQAMQNWQKYYGVKNAAQ